jgi:serine/threonine protein kinase
MPPTPDPDRAPNPNEESSSPSPPDVAKLNLVGKILGGRYLLEKELSRGGMATVYLARDKPELHSRRVVVKVLLEEALKNEWVVQKFHQEIESLTRIDDPGVIGIFDAGKLDDGTPYLVMQYVEGTTLRERIKPEGMDLEEVANIIRQVGCSVTAAHEAGILHRDLKPENIMVRQSATGEQQVKIIDFGIAKVKNSVVGASTVTGITAGTISYMSPEQLSVEPLTPASDIYVLGMIAYEMLTGQKPFNPDSMFQLLEMQRAGVSIKPAVLRPVVPEQAEAVVLKALAFEPEDRYQRAQEFGDQLAVALTTENNAAIREGFSIDKSDRLTNSNPDVFISYSSSDKKTADAICASLEGSGISCWLAPRNISPGKDWGEAIIDGISQSRVMVLVFSAKANQSPQVKREVERAVNKNIPVIPFRTEDVPMSKALEYYLSTAHWLDAYTKPLSKHLEYLATTVRSLIGQSETETKLHVPDKSPTNKLIWPAMAIIVLGILVGAFVWWRRAAGVKPPINRDATTVVQPAPERAFSYSMVVQKYREGRPHQKPYTIPGEINFEPDDRVQLLFTSPQQGYLYLINRGPDQPVPTNSLILYPDNGQSALLPANQQAQIPAPSKNPDEDWIGFDKETGAEQLWVIWSEKPVSALEAVKKWSNPKDLGEIKDAAQDKQVREFLAHYEGSLPDGKRNQDGTKTTVTGIGEVVVFRIILQHH